MENELAKLIDEFGEFKQSEKVYKKHNDTIKTLMGENNLSEFTTEKFKASYTLEKRESMNMEMLLELLKAELGDYATELGVIKTREYIDEDALENALYHENIDSEVLLKMDKCKEVKRIPKLRITKIKKKED